MTNQELKIQLQRLLDSNISTQSEKQQLQQLKNDIDRNSLKHIKNNSKYIEARNEFNNTGQQTSVEVPKIRKGK
jgi:hypothetical protein